MTMQLPTARSGSEPSDAASAPARSGDDAAPSAALPATYDDAIGELERLVAAMESGKLPLEQLLQAYQRGADLLDFCRKRLDSVERQVSVLEEGRLKPWVAA